MTEPEPTSEPTAAHEPAQEPAQHHPAVANPFVPRYREPWVNPAKRTPAVVVALASAVVLLAAGFLLGLGLGGGHGRGHAEFRERPGAGRFVPGQGAYYAPHARGWGNYQHGPIPVPTTYPSPTTVPTSSHS